MRNPNRRRAAGERTDALIVHVVHRLAEAAVDEVRARYDLGLLVQRACSSSFGRMGGRRVAELAARLRMDESDLRRHARVRGAVAEAEFDALMTLRNASGMPLSWSHLERLARVQSATRRQQLAKSVLVRRWSVRELTANLRLAATASNAT